MRLQIDKLGKVSITVSKYSWDINKDYDKLVIINDNNTYKSYISRKPVPKGININNTDYWQCFAQLNGQFDRVFDGGNASTKYAGARVLEGGCSSTKYGGARIINCGYANNII